MSVITVQAGVGAYVAARQPAAAARALATIEDTGRLPWTNCAAY